MAENKADYIPDYPEVKLIRTLGYGFVGTTYLTEEASGVQHVTKIEKFDGDTSLASTYGRQLAFDKDVAQHNVDTFTTIQSLKIVENAKHIQNVPKKPGFDEHMYRTINARPHVFITNYIPVLDGTYESVSHMLSKKQELVLIYKIMRGIRVMQLAGYRHRDISGKNVMYRADKAYPPTHANYYQWYIIDYGSVHHPSFIEKDSDKYYDQYRGNDIVALVIMLVKNKLYEYAAKKGLNIPKFNRLAAQIRKTPIYKKTLLSFIPNMDIIDDKTLVLFLEIAHNHAYVSMCLPRFPYNLIVRQQNEETLIFLLKHSHTLDISDTNAIIRYLGIIMGH